MWFSINNSALINHHQASVLSIELTYAVRLIFLSSFFFIGITLKQHWGRQQLVSDKAEHIQKILTFTINKKYIYHVYTVP